jgi:hypothetical protein
MQFFVPPGGFAGFNQMTPSSRRALTVGAPRSTGQPKRRKKRGRTSQSARRASPKRKRSSGRKMKFGSPAWQKKYKVGRFAKK